MARWASRPVIVADPALVGCSGIPPNKEHLCRAVVLDAWSRRVVGWSMAGHLRTERVLAALLNMAIWRRRPQGVVHHSGQGAQYTSVSFGQRCRQAGVRPSTGAVGCI